MAVQLEGPRHFVELALALFGEFDLPDFDVGCESGGGHKTAAGRHLRAVRVHIACVQGLQDVTADAPDRHGRYVGTGHDELAGTGEAHSDHIRAVRLGKRDDGLNVAEAAVVLPVNLVDFAAIFRGLVDNVGLAVRTPLDFGGVVVGDVAAYTLVLLGAEVFGEPNEDGSIRGAAGQVLAVLAQIQIADGAAVSFEAGQQPLVAEIVLDLGRLQVLDPFLLCGAAGLKIIIAP